MTESSPTKQGSVGVESAHTTSTDLPLNLHRYFQLMVKRGWLILGVLAVVVGAAAVWTFSRVPIYQATATVLLERRAPQVLGAQVSEVVDTSMNTYWRNKEYMETQVRVITSKSLARAVAAKLNLPNNRVFWFSSKEGKGPIASPKGRTRTIEDSAAHLLSLLNVTAVRDADILAISVRHQSPEMAAQLANAVVQAYREQGLDYKVSSTSGAVQWLSDQLDDLKAQLEGSELALYQFKKSNNMVDVSLEDKQTLISRRIERLQDALTEVQLKRMETTALRKQFVDARGKDPLDITVGEVLSSPTVRSLKESYVQEQQKYRALRERYLEQHPLVRQQNATIAAIRRNLGDEINKELASVESKFRELRDHEGQLAQALQGAKNESLELNKRELEYRRLQRNTENTSKLYAMVLSRMKESDLSSQLRVSNIRSLDPAIAPKTPISPRVRLNLAFGLFFGLFLGLGVALLVEFIDNTVKWPEDIEQSAGLVTLGVVPRIAGSTGQNSANNPVAPADFELVVHRASKSAVAESCRAIRTNLLFASTDRSLRTMVVTSPGPSEGKTTTAINLAIAMAQAGSRVLLVDTDMRRPRVHRVFGVAGSKGVSSLLLGDDKPEDVIKTTEVPQLFILPCGPIPPNPAELCQSERFKQMLAGLTERFDRVVLDSPPVLVVTDSAVLSTHVDGTVLVARSGKTTRPALREAARQLSDVGATLFGCVLNDMNLERRAYGYYRYRRYGYSRYGHGYGYGRTTEENEAAAS